MRRFEVVSRLVVILLVACAVTCLGLHHHESDSSEPHCAICHFVAGLVATVILTAGVFAFPTVREWALPRPPDRKHVSLCLAACGLRAPPASL